MCFLQSPAQSTQWVYSVGLVVVSARTNKSHHHHHQDSWKGPDTRHAIGVWVFEWRAGLEGARSGVHHKRG